MTSLVKRSVSIGGHRTSISLEPAFHAELEAIATARKVSLAALVAEIDAARHTDTNLSSAIRLFVLADLKSKIMHVPNAATRTAMAELEAGEGRRFSTVEDLLKD